MTAEGQNGYRQAAWYDQLDADERAEADYVAGMDHGFAIRYLAVHNRQAREYLKQIDTRTQRVEAKLDILMEDSPPSARSYTAWMGPVSALTIVGYVLAKLLGVPL